MGRTSSTSSERQADLFAAFPANDDSAPSATVRPNTRGRSVQAATARRPSEDELAKQLEQTGRYRVMRQLMPRPVVPTPSP